ncbi:MAG: hypothetical protein AB7V77_04580 [Candidatus Woesearchaeota archaeon]
MNLKEVILNNYNKYKNSSNKVKKIILSSILISSLTTSYLLNKLYNKWQYESFYIPDGTQKEYVERLLELYKPKEKQSESSRAKALNISKNYSNKLNENDSIDIFNKISLSQYMSEQDIAINYVLNNLDWNKVADKYDLNSNKLSLVQEMSKIIDSRLLTTIILSELMKHEDGEKNIKRLDDLLKHSGKDYLELIPAKYDGDILSYGPYQITPYALGEGELRFHPISEIHQCIKNDVSRIIPGSVYDLKNEDHHESTTYLAIYNLINLVKKLDDKSYSKLNDSKAIYKNSIAQYIINAHHLPSYAIKAFSEGLEDNFDEEFTEYTNEKLKYYSEKVNANSKSTYK